MSAKNSAEQTLCPALMIAAPSSGSGKTTITAALAYYHSLQGKKVTVFKMGPDFIDPMILSQASGASVYQLDLWLVGEDDCRALLFNAAKHSDLILIEGVMGLFDGTPSSADLAELFGIPVLAVIDASAMAQTFSALAFGLANFRPSLPFAGVFANRVNSDGHGDLLAKNLPKNLQYYGRMPRDNAISFPERHLGLVQAQELVDLKNNLAMSAQHIDKTKLKELPAAVTFIQHQSVNIDPSQPLSNICIIIVQDLAFNFLYRANVELLEQLGADIVFCSALTDEALPKGDVLYIPGGYPELYAQTLSANTRFIDSVKCFAKQKKNIIAECGGMLYLLDQLTDLEGQHYQMAGILPGKATMQNKLAAIGSQFVRFSCFEEVENQVMRGHSFHYSLSSVGVTPIAESEHHLSNRQGEKVYQYGNVLASYLHWYLPSNPELAVQMFKKK